MESLIFIKLYLGAKYNYYIVEYEVEYFRLDNTFELEIDKLVNVLKTNYNSIARSFYSHIVFFFVYSRFDLQSKQLIP